MEYNEDDFLMLSGIQHFAFCRRQWALIHIEQQWEDNLRTVEGEFMHEKCHDSYSSESRRNIIVSRGIPVFSRSLGISGECDIVEFTKSPDGIELNGREGLYCVFPIEYKHGEPKDSDIDILQLTAQAMCLEEMLCCEIQRGAIFYGKIKRRQAVEITDELKKRVREMICEMHGYFERGYVPKARQNKSCNACSLKNVCLPKLSNKESASEYLERNLGVEV